MLASEFWISFDLEGTMPIFSASCTWSKAICPCLSSVVRITDHTCTNTFTKKRNCLSKTFVLTCEAACTCFLVGRGKNLCTCAPDALLLYQAGGQQSDNNICFKQKSKLQGLWGFGECINSSFKIWWELDLANLFLLIRMWSKAYWIQWQDVLFLMGAIPGTLGFESNLEFSINPLLLINKRGLNSFWCSRAKHKAACFCLESHSCSCRSLSCLKYLKLHKTAGEQHRNSAEREAF